MDEIDVRILTLKKWNLPQNISLYQQFRNGAERLGEYVSFQNYNFIDVQKVDVFTNISNESESTVFSEAYRHIQKEREKGHGQQNTYTQQNIILLGHSNEFWETKPNALYVSMLQLRDLDQVDHEELITAISTVFEECGIKKNQYAIYYSFDFCDIVIFSKNIWPDELQRVLWSLCPHGKGILQNILDTITTCSINNEFLMQQFENIEKGNLHSNYKNSDAAEKHLSVLLSLSIQSEDFWIRLITKLKKMKNTSVTPYRTTGRYDVDIFIRNITVSQVFKILYWLDTAQANSSCNKSRYPDIGSGGYEITLYTETPRDESNSDIAKRIYIENNFATIGKKTLMKLFDSYESALKEKGIYPWGYANEIKRSLLALLANGFAEEFVLSVYHSFAEYLRCVTANINDLSADQLFTFQRDYFQALSMLTNCTMHSEKQFIQAPAFNAVLSDVPPKLLAYYTCVAFQATNILNDEPDKVFSFLFVPDFRQDIHMLPISPVTWDHGKTAIIYLNEKMFYNPVAVIQTMCHEIAHHVGNKTRMREERADHIFNTIAAELLTIAIFKNKDLTPEEVIVLNELVKPFSKSLKEIYKKWSSCSESNRLWYMDDISEFIHTGNYFVFTFFNPDNTSILQNKIRSYLNHAKPSCVSSIIKCNNRGLKDQYLTQLYEEAATKEYATLLLSEMIVENIRDELDKWGNIHTENVVGGYFYHTVFCSDILDSYREAYADLRMVQLLNINDEEIYENILNDNTSFIEGIENNYSYRIRRQAVRDTLNNKHSVPLEALVQSGDCGYKIHKEVHKIVLRELTSYLTSCKKKFNPSASKPDYARNIQSAVNCIQAFDATTLFASVCNSIVFYRNALIDYCGREESCNCRQIKNESHC